MPIAMDDDAPARGQLAPLIERIDGLEAELRDHKARLRMVETQLGISDRAQSSWLSLPPPTVQNASFSWPPFERASRNFDANPDQPAQDVAAPERPCPIRDHGGPAGSCEAPPVSSPTALGDRGRPEPLPRYAAYLR